MLSLDVSQLQSFYLTVLSLTMKTDSAKLPNGSIPTLVPGEIIPVGFTIPKNLILKSLTASKLPPKKYSSSLRYWSWSELAARI